MDEATKEIQIDFAAVLCALMRRTGQREIKVSHAELTDLAIQLVVSYSANGDMQVSLAAPGTGLSQIDIDRMQAEADRTGVPVTTTVKLPADNRKAVD